jgi:hypothetical protein
MSATLDGIYVSEDVMDIASRIYWAKLNRAPRWDRMHPKECAFWFARAQQAIVDGVNGWAFDEYLMDCEADASLMGLRDGEAW